MKAPTLSILMPLYNAEPYVGKAIESILSQSFTDFEFLICDDGSSDQSMKVAATFNDPRIRFLHNEKNLGSCLTRNKLLKEAQGSYMVWQDADDIALPGKLQKQVDFLNSNPEVMICGTWNEMVSVKGTFLKSVKAPTQHENILKAFETSIPLCFATTMFRAEVLSTVGYIRDYFKDLGYYDYDWMYRIVEKHASANIPEVLYSRMLMINSNSMRIGNIRKQFGHKMVMFLGQQRKETGTDSLFEGNGQLEKFNLEQELMYAKAPSTFAREKSEFFFATNLFGPAFRFGLRAIAQEPFKILNYRTLLYIVRKSFLAKSPQRES